MLIAAKQFGGFRDEILRCAQDDVGAQDDIRCD